MTKHNYGGTEDLVMHMLTQRELTLINVLRERALDFGKVMCIVYYQEGAIARVELEKVVESVKIG